MKRPITLLVVTLLASLLISSITSAQVAERPTLQLGEWWELSIRTNNVEHGPFIQLDGEYRFEVVQDGIKCLYKDGGKWTDNCGEAKEIVLETLLGTGNYKYLDFPLSVGKRWKYSGWYSAGVSVITQTETITVAGNTLPAYRIKREGEWRSRRGRHSGPVDVLYWYAPACKCIPKFTHKSQGHAAGKEIIEINLINYRTTK